MKRLLIISISAICILVLIGILNKDNKEQKMIETAAKEEAEMKEIETRHNDTESFTSYFKNEYGVNFENLIILDNQLDLYLIYSDISEELAQTVSVEALEYLQNQNINYDVEITIKSEKRDEYGQNQVYYPFNLKVKNDTLNKFKFDVFDADNLESTVDEYFYY